MNYLCLYVKLHSPKACAITGDFQNTPRAHKNYEMHLILRLLLSSLTGLTVVKSTGPRLCTTLLFLMLLSMIFWPSQRDYFKEERMKSASMLSLLSTDMLVED